jgi:ribosome-associated translation inhibitor RaiA
MNPTIEVRSRNAELPPEVEHWIRSELGDLQRFYGGILSCHVTVEQPHLHHQRGNPYHLRVELVVPGGDIVVKHQPNIHRGIRQAGAAERLKQLDVEARYKDLRVALADAFKTVGRRLQDYVRRRRGQTKVHEPLRWDTLRDSSRKKATAFSRQRTAAKSIFTGRASWETDSNGWRSARR